MSQKEVTIIPIVLSKLQDIQLQYSKSRMVVIVIIIALTERDLSFRKREQLLI
jgi:hypothetical protein